MNKLPDPTLIPRRDELDEALARIGPGQIVGDEPAEESDHFMTCPACGQALDCRDLGQVFHHHKPGHDPIPRQ